MTIHLSNSWLCPDCDRVGSDANQCHSCTNRHGLLNLGSVLNRKQPLMVETTAILGMMREVVGEVIA